mgnify:CR=1 FL=1
MLWAAFTGIAFLCGSIPFSVWLGRLFLRQDVRQYGDGNPGAANVFRAGNQALGLFVLVLDVAKAALYLASDDAAWVTGATLNVDGGLMAGSYGMARALDGGAE